MNIFKICSLIVILPLLTACSLGSNQIPTDPPPTININNNKAPEEVVEVEDNGMENEEESMEFEAMPVDPNMEMEVQEFENTVDDESEVEMLEGEIDILLDDYEQFVD